VELNELFLNLKKEIISEHEGQKLFPFYRERRDFEGKRGDKVRLIFR
jgi:hypothetical protein